MTELNNPFPSLVSHDTKSTVNLMWRLNISNIKPIHKQSSHNLNTQQCQIEPLTHNGQTNNYISRIISLHRIQKRTNKIFSINICNDGKLKNPLNKLADYELLENTRIETNTNTNESYHRSQRKTATEVKTPLLKLFISNKPSTRQTKYRNLDKQRTLSHSSVSLNSKKCNYNDTANPLRMSRSRTLKALNGIINECKTIECQFNHDENNFERKKNKIQRTIEDSREANKIFVNINGLSNSKKLHQCFYEVQKKKVSWTLNRISRNKEIDEEITKEGYDNYKKDRYKYEKLLHKMIVEKTRKDKDKENKRNTLFKNYTEKVLIVNKFYK